MRFFITVLACTAYIATAIAQTSQIAFTSVPAVVVAGSTYNITWSGGDGTSPVTITLRKGNPAHLDTVSTITSDASGFSYEWQVPKSLTSASDYALQIAQGQSDVNYSGLFSVVGGTGTSSVASSTAKTSDATATSSISTTSSTSTGTTASTSTSSTTSGTTTSSSATASLTSLSLSGPLVTSTTTTPTSIVASTVVQSTTTPTGAASQLVSPGSFLLVAFMATFFV